MFGVARTALAVLAAASPALGMGAGVPATVAVEEVASVEARPAAAAAPLAPAAAPAAWWQLKQGLPVHLQLQSWAQQVGWTFNWHPKVTWLVAADVGFSGDFPEALKEVVEGLFYEGKPIRLVIWEGNRLAEVVSSDVR